ncbi:hypothetical protein HK099_007835 [Clydaea vesicula]|uniref:ornithine decarboxylase n=1 Tax=Clydaea vesicula TaxID=447962 RepID=A0AAD5U7X4_9FUNG|nr:hypothetical protein HK099_007835 [Clydaea vesicula]
MKFSNNDIKLTQNKQLLPNFVNKSFSNNSATKIINVSNSPVSSILHDTLAGMNSDDESDAFYVCDLAQVELQFHRFKKLLPRVIPFFAMKCNPDENVIKTLINLGAGFDCASKNELQTILNLGVSPSSIIYANPCKQASHVRYAAKNEVSLMTFDNADELHKIKAIFPTAKLVLRILADDSRSLCKFGVKFGASLSDVSMLLQVAKSLELDVVGISFHVGSGCYDASAFSDAVLLAKEAFDIGEKLGFNFELLDGNFQNLIDKLILLVGGGFPGYGAEGVSFEQIALKLGPVIDACFPPHVKIIAEPGRYFVSNAFTLAVNICSRRKIKVSDCDATKEFRYYINDGMYGSFNCITFDHYKPIPKILKAKKNFYYQKNEKLLEELYSSSIWGPTCDSMDVIATNYLLPELEIGDWLYFDSMGAYTSAAGSVFNGFMKPRIFYTNTLH